MAIRVRGQADSYSTSVRNLTNFPDTPPPLLRKLAKRSFREHVCQFAREHLFSRNVAPQTPQGAAIGSALKQRPVKASPVTPVIANRPVKTSRRDWLALNEVKQGPQGRIQKLPCDANAPKPWQLTGSHGIREVLAVFQVAPVAIF